MRALFIGKANQDGTYSQALRLYLLNRIPENFSQIDTLAEFIYKPVRISKQFFENLQSKIHSQKKLKLSPFQESILTQLKSLVRTVENYQNKLIGEFDISKPLSEEMRQSMFLTHRKIYKDFTVGLIKNSKYKPIS